MKIFFASSSKIWDDPAWVAEISDVGFDGWEISADGNYRLDKTETFAAVKKAVDENGLDVSVHAPFSDLNPASINMPIWEETVRQFTVCIEQAALLTDTVVIHPGYLSPVSRFDGSSAWNNHKQACIRLGETAQQVGVTACLENMPNLDDFFCRDPYEQDGFVDGVPGMGLVLDIGHAHTTGNLDEFCKIILPKAHHLHIHDNHGKYDEHLPLGSGTINWEKIMPRIVKDYKGKIIVVEGRNPKEGKKSLEFLRRWI